MIYLMDRDIVIFIRFLHVNFSRLLMHNSIKYLAEGAFWLPGSMKSSHVIHMSMILLFGKF